MLESFVHEDNSFVTLTYDNEHLPMDGTLVPRHTQLWIKRFRKELDRIEGRKMRFFLCGEYGDETFRPHYHLSMFGVGPEFAELVQDTWRLGFTHTAEFNEKTAQYVCGYVLKKMTTKDDPRLGGRHPEFTRMSNRPGIGAKAMEVIRDAVLTDAGLDEYERTGDVPRKFNIGRRSFPLGRYLMSKLREEVGIGEKTKEIRKAEWQAEYAEKVLPMLKRSISAGEAATSSQLLAAERLGAIRNVEGRSKLYRKRNTI